MKIFTIIFSGINLIPLVVINYNFSVDNYKFILCLNILYFAVAYAMFAKAESVENFKKKLDNITNPFDHTYNIYLNSIKADLEERKNRYEKLRESSQIEEKLAKTVDEYFKQKNIKEENNETR